MYSVLFRSDLLLWKSVYSSCSSCSSSSFAIELDWVPLLRVVWGMVVLLSLSLSLFLLHLALTKKKTALVASIFLSRASRTYTGFGSDKLRVRFSL